MSPSKIVCSIFLARNQLVRVKKLSVSSSPNFMNDSRFQINEYSSRHVLARTSLAKEGVKSIVCNTY